MAVYYIDPAGGKEDHSGRTQEEAALTNKGLQVKPGDTVLFKCGSVIRDALWNVEGTEEQPVIYGAYGEGRKPVFCGSADVSSRDLWIEEEKNIWKCVQELETEVCNFVFDIEENKSFGTLVWKKEKLKANGEWWDERIAKNGQEDGDRKSQVLLYCEENPGDYYSHIECVTHKHRSLAATGRNMIIRDLIFCNNGIHAIAGEGPTENFSVENCEFYHIGGCVWSYERKIRFGNAVEFWNIAENVKVEACLFDNIYDSGVTHQGGKGCRPARELYIKNNRFLRCGMAAYEQRDHMPLSGEFSGNLCAEAGKGFSHLHIIPPRNSEIWPQPMGHHLFFWRICEASETAKFLIKGNIFQNAPYGAAIYSIISETAEEKLIFTGNHYDMEQCEMIAWLEGKKLRIRG